MRKIISPDIVSSRKAKMDSGNLWTCIDYINKQLTQNPIRLDGSIEVTADFVMDSVVVEKLKNMYLGVGWSNIVITYTDSVNGYPGKTIVNFYL